MCLLIGVEALVGWLLDHADVQVTDLSDADTGSEDCSDEELMEDVDDMACAMVSIRCGCPLPVPTCPVLWVPPGHSRGSLGFCWARRDVSAGRVFLVLTFRFKTDPCFTI